MEQVRLGASGLHVSRVCLGMMSYGTIAWRPWVLDEERAAPIVRAAVEAGITFFDTADIYSDGASEIVTGNSCDHSCRATNSCSRPSSSAP